MRTASLANLRALAAKAMNGGFLSTGAAATTGSMGNRFAAGAILAICSAAIRAEEAFAFVSNVYAGRQTASRRLA
jgi:hypothetical protein